MRGQTGLRPRARQNGRLLQRILQRFDEVVFGHLQVVLRSDRFRVPDPVTHHLDGKLIGELSLAGTPEVLEELGPRLQAGSLDDLHHQGSQIAVRSPVPCDDKLLARFSLVEAQFEMR